MGKIYKSLFGRIINAAIACYRFPRRYSLLKPKRPKATAIENRGQMFDNRNGVFKLLQIRVLVVGTTSNPQ